jgi:hypothetical protein
VAARSKLWVSGRSLVGTVGSNVARGIGVCLFGMFVFSGRGLCDELIIRPGFLPSVVCLSVIMNP